MYSTPNEWKSTVNARCNRTFKNEIHKYMPSTSKTLCIDNFDDIVNKQNNIYHRTIKVTLVDVTLSTFVDLK